VLTTTAIAGRAHLFASAKTIDHVARSQFFSFGQNARRSSVPAKHYTAIARSGGPGRPSGRRASASPLTVASTMAALRSLGTMLCIVVILVASILSSGAAYAEQGSSPTRRPNELSVRPFAAFVTEASKRFGVPEHWIRAVMRAESSRQTASSIKKGRRGIDANHAKDLDRIARSLRSWSRSL
jgi:soluble lytic murein transglycosylase-like protein